jgi:chemotaxis protein MotB
MVSFADMITIMMSFFVIMFALASAKNEGKREAAIDSIEYRFGPQWSPFGKLGRGIFKTAELSRPAAGGGEGGQLLPSGAKLPGAGLAGRANLPAEGNLAGIGGSVFFDEWSADLSQQQKANLAAIAKGCAGKPQKIEVLGHTSRRPMPAGLPYRDHWDLAYARARRVADLLIAMGVDPQRIRIGVAGSTEPAPTRDAASYVRTNSRVDVYLLEILVTDFKDSPALPGPTSGTP